ncbi:ATP-binding protein [Flavobacterium sp. LC2016-23]|uniref:tetratricopeptide repeat-containing sensor histidine kinase n=1 Tax=Flavobacterium sp. LC2016-23 TaxID=2666330 RepID=UPI0012B00E2D|nr:tetratricopeptide repeat-containing sensor histidine kinase [Flavobacterium sp. LC2016-23]MRX39001.1 ATP-binding protein [Flavobacterium sp. LC2016-23]
MLRSPFLYLFVSLFLLSCNEHSTTPIDPTRFTKEAKILQEKGFSNLQKSNFNSAFYYFNKSKITFETYKDSANIVYNLMQMAYIQQINGDYYGSKETLTESLPYLKNDNNYGVAINNFFGIADKELSLYDDAILYYKKAIKDSKDTLSKQAPLNNIAVVYIKQKKYPEAIAILESIVKSNILSDKIADKRSPEIHKSKARVLDNLGFAYFKNGMEDKGLAFMKESLALRKQIEDPYGSIESYLHLAEYYSRTNLAKSNQNAQMAYELATKFNSVDERLKALSFLISNGSGTQYAQKYIVINDSIIKIRNNFKNKFAKIKYDSKKEKEENQKLKLERAENLLSLQKVKYQRIFFIIGILALFFFVLYLRKRNRIEKIKTAYDTETRIAKDIHDELANDVFNAMTFTQTQSLDTENKETLIQKLDHIYARVRRISRENNTIDTKLNYAVNLKEMLSTYNIERTTNTEGTNVIITSIENANWEDVDDLKKVAIYRVLQELMVNMKKHSGASVVVVKFDTSDNSILINYSDNGKGAEKNKIIKNGLQNMENRILAMKGSIIFDTEPGKGFKVKITMPK